ncbi:phenolic acid decarboxylase [Shewanella mangrovi]|uniref:Phenolic acid decarboxylase n=1 Tax=Shewanella mangrovi TaxID=1515746 RepID=A0A094JEU7_9GAMM|nr:phenolic acid decarboxylase [Shewanella mangrovi]KFZ37747.1 phenolic acid decarboxylase [Shewanella mangrovi]
MFDKNDVSGIVGKHLVYTYDNGWNYEIYVKNAETMDYRIHSGIVANRWVKDQHIYLVRVASDVYKISWTEPTGTDVSLIINFADSVFHGTIFFPRWIINEPQKTVCFQNEHIEQMRAYRDAGPVYPTEVIDEFATITFVRDCGENNDEVINCPASELPADFPNNLK